MATPLKPVEAFVESGFLQRMSEKFGCPFIAVDASDKIQGVQRYFKGLGKEVTYPYATVLIQTWGPTTDTYTSNRMMRVGLPVFVEDDNRSRHNVRLLPVTFDYQIEYKTTNHKGLQAFVRRWLFTRRNGASSFTIVYGSLKLTVQVLLTDSISFTPRENPTENETSYTLELTASIKGFMSESTLRSEGVVTQVALEEVLAANGFSGAQMFKF